MSANQIKSEVKTKDVVMNGDSIKNGNSPLNSSTTSNGTSSIISNSPGSKKRQGDPIKCKLFYFLSGKTCALPNFYGR